MKYILAIRQLVWDFERRRWDGITKGKKTKKSSYDIY